jgi:nitrous oxidase accessory protein NosD
MDSSNLITENTIQNNKYGISFSGANSVGTPSETVYHNNFINNEEHVSPFNRQPLDFMPAPPESYWDNGREGNFWSNYNGTDTNGDGIGETAYVGSIYHNITDRYPLTKPYPIALNPPTTTSPPPPQSPEPVATSTPSGSPTLQPTLNPTSVLPDYYGGDVNILSLILGVIALAVASAAVILVFFIKRRKLTK